MSFQSLCLLMPQVLHEGMTCDLSLLQWESQSGSGIIWSFLEEELWCSEPISSYVSSHVWKTLLWVEKTKPPESSQDEQVVPGSGPCFYAESLDCILNILTASQLHLLWISSTLSFPKDDITAQSSEDWYDGVRRLAVIETEWASYVTEVGSGDREKEN